MSRILAAMGCLLLATGNLPAQKKEPRPTPLLLTPAKLPVPALRFNLLPELREQKPGNGAVLYRKASEQLKDFPGVTLSHWEELPLSELPREEVRKTLARYKETLDLLHQAARSEQCDFEIAQRLREQGFSASLAEMQKMRSASLLLGVKVHLELAEDRPDLALRTLQTAYALGRDVGKEPSLICSLIGVAITTRANQALELTLNHPKTPNLSASLLMLPHPFIDMRRPLEGERLWLLGTFPGIQEVITNPDAGPLPPEQIEKWSKLLNQLAGGKLSVARAGSAGWPTSAGSTRRPRGPWSPQAGPASSWRNGPTCRLP